MRNIILLLFVCFAINFACTSCVTTASTYEYGYEPYNETENVVVVGETCYVYYTQPTTLFLKTLKVVDGRFFYFDGVRDRIVVFPRWKEWRPNRFYYYDRNRFSWRNRNDIYRNRYNHNKPIKKEQHKNSDVKHKKHTDNNDKRDYPTLHNRNASNGRKTVQRHSFGTTKSLGRR